MYSWAMEHYVLTFILLFEAIFQTSIIIRRVFRLVMVSIHGWPTAPRMDADGDIVYPKKDNS